MVHVGGGRAAPLQVLKHAACCGIPVKLAQRLRDLLSVPRGRADQPSQRGGRIVGMLRDPGAGQRVVEALDEVLDAHRQSPVTLLLETTAGQGTSLGFRFEHLAGIIDRVRQPERLGVCLEDGPPLESSQTGLPVSWDPEGESLLLTDIEVEGARSLAHLLRYEIWNADGTPAGQCGNGARCFMRFVREHGLTDTSIDAHMFGGIWPEMLGTLYLTIGAILFAVPMGIISAIQIEFDLTVVAALLAVATMGSFCEKVPEREWERLSVP